LTVGDATMFGVRVMLNDSFGGVDVSAAGGASVALACGAAEAAVGATAAGAAVFVAGAAGAGGGV
jgi:hypothetical protein